MDDVIVVDSDILIDAGMNIQHAVDCLKHHERQATLAVSIITKMELVVGCRDKNELRNTEKFFNRFQVVPVNENISEKTYELLLKYRLSHGLLML